MIRIMYDDLPPRELHPNARVHPWVKREAGRNFKQYFYVMAKALAGVSYTRASVQYIFEVPDRRRRDPDKLMACMTWALDGLVAAKVVEEDDYNHITILSPIVWVTPGKSRTIVEIDSIETRR